VGGFGRPGRRCLENQAEFEPGVMGNLLVDTQAADD
jgi:hypothetical protein